MTNRAHGPNRPEPLLVGHEAVVAGQKLDCGPLYLGAITSIGEL